MGDEGPLLVFAGHTDVVPPGSVDDWRYPPFQPTEDGEFLYGRGSADMKSSLAAMVTACERFVANRRPAARLAFLITSDEEGQAVEGTRYVMEQLTQRGEKDKLLRCRRTKQLRAVGRHHSDRSPWLTFLQTAGEGHQRTRSLSSFGTQPDSRGTPCATTTG